MNGETLEEVDKFKYLALRKADTENQERGEDKTGASTLSHDKASNTAEKQNIQFSHKDYTL